jgi:hypothetical protein
VNINPQSNTDFTQVTCTVHFYYKLKYACTQNQEFNFGQFPFIVDVICLTVIICGSFKMFLFLPHYPPIFAPIIFDVHAPIATSISAYLAKIM